MGGLVLRELDRLVALSRVDPRGASFGSTGLGATPKNFERETSGK